ncbi:MAG: hypothetical protein QM688_04710 [Sphingomonas bacterium]
MTRPTPPRFRVLALAFALAGGAFWSIPSRAQSAPAAPPPATGDTIRLTDEQRDLILSGITEDSAAAARGELTGAERAERRIHGEVGVMIGSNGTRGAYGTAAIPLGDNAGAVVSFESTRFGYRR